MGVIYEENTDDGVYDRCETCEVAATRERERQWMKVFGVDRKQAAVLQFVWRFETVAAGRFVGLANAGHELTAKFRRAEAMYVIRTNEHAKCVCGQSGGDYECIPALRIVRSDVRQVVQERFGDVMNVSRLISLPAGWVEWEKAHLVSASVDSSTGEVVLAEEGVSLDKYLARYVGVQKYSLNALFESLSKREVLEGYCYLQLFAPQHKLAAYRLCGKFPELSKVFTMPDSWFSWERFPALRVTSSSLCHIGVEGARPLVSWLIDEVGAAVAQRQHSVMRVGGVLDPSALYVKVVRRGGDWRRPHAKTQLIEASGPVSVPDGYVLFRMRHEGFLCLPKGVYVHTANEVFGDDGTPVNVLIQDATVLRFTSTRYVDDEERFSGCMASFVALRGSALEKWYRRVLDPKSTDARFITSVDSGAIVLRWPGESRYTEAQCFDQGRHVVLTDPLDSWKGTSECRVEVDITTSGPVVDVGHFHQFAGFRGFRTGASDNIIVNKCVSVNDNSVLVMLGAVSVASARSDEAEMSLHVIVQVDDYVIDGGGPSDSGGYLEEFFDDLDSGDGAILFSEYQGSRLKDMSQSDLARVPGFCYVRLLSDKYFMSVATELGSYPTLQSLLGVRQHKLCEDVFRTRRLVKRGTMLHVEVAPLLDGKPSWDVVVLDGSMKVDPYTECLGSLLARYEDDEVLVRKLDLITGDMIVGALSVPVVIGLSVSVTLNVVAVVYFVLKMFAGGGTKRNRVRY